MTLVGKSPAMRRLRERIRRIGQSGINVLVQGETGTGKEIVAHQLHAASGGSKLVIVNCAGIPEPLLESELFGHKRGAFTGADRDRPGRFQAANGGTLFLDEIGELAPGLQAKLLRALESGEVQRVGDDEPRHVRVRIIAATNRHLDDEVRQGRMREDLYYRLAIARIEVPPLRERDGDIRLLAEHFAGATSLAEAVFPLLEAYSWPGNVRELKNEVEVATVESAGRLILPEHLPERIRSGTKRPEPNRGPSRSDARTSREPERGGKLPEDEAEARRLIEEALVTAGWNKPAAAAQLGISRGHLYVKIKDLGIQRDGRSEGRA